MVDALLKLSRLENRANPVEFSKVDLVEMVDTVVATTRLMLKNLVSNLRIITIHMYMFMAMLTCCAKLRRILFRMLYVIP